MIDLGSERVELGLGRKDDHVAEYFPDLSKSLAVFNELLKRRNPQGWDAEYRLHDEVTKNPELYATVMSSMNLRDRDDVIDRNLADLDIEDADVLEVKSAKIKEMRLVIKIKRAPHWTDLSL